MRACACNCDFNCRPDSWMCFARALIVAHSATAPIFPTPLTPFQLFNDNLTLPNQASSPLHTYNTQYKHTAHNSCGDLAVVAGTVVWVQFPVTAERLPHQVLHVDRQSSDKWLQSLACPSYRMSHLVAASFDCRLFTRQKSFVIPSYRTSHSVPASVDCL